MRVDVGDLVSYRFGDVNIMGIVLSVSKISPWDGPEPGEFTMRLFELDSYVSEWDVLPNDVIIVNSR